RLASDVSTTARFGVHWRGADIGSGLAYFRVQYTRLTARSGRAHATARYHTLRRATARTALSFKGRLGATDLFRARAGDRAGNARRVSLYSRRVAQRRVVFRASRPGSRHVLRVDVLARRPRHSRGREVALDGFAVRLLS